MNSFDKASFLQQLLAAECEIDPDAIDQLVESVQSRISSFGAAEAAAVVWGELEQLSSKQVRDLAEFIDVSPSLLSLIAQPASLELTIEGLRRFSAGLDTDSCSLCAGIVSDTSGVESFDFDEVQSLLIDAAEHSTSDEGSCCRAPESELEQRGSDQLSERIFFTASVLPIDQQRKLLDYALGQLGDREETIPQRCLRLRTELGVADRTIIDFLSVSEQSFSVDELAQKISSSPDQVLACIEAIAASCDGIRLDPAENRIQLSGPLRAGWLEAIDRDRVGD